VTLAELATSLARGESPAGIEILKRSPVRCVARRGDVVLKVLLKRAHKAAREAAALRRARDLGVAVPELIDAGAGWVATRYLPGRPARRDDLALFLPVVSELHERGVLHGDLHLGNIWISEGKPVLLDVQKARFGALVVKLLQRWELGYLAFSLGDPVPPELSHAEWWRARRARTHWRSRTKRCTVESSGFTAYTSRASDAGETWRGYRVRHVDASALDAAIRAATTTPEPLRRTPSATVARTERWIVKRFRTERAARSAWIGGWGLEVRGFEPARALAWAGPWLIMEDAGATLTDWVERRFATASKAEREQLADASADLLARLHSLGVYHPDLKANNVCWSPGSVPRLLDYGGVRFGRSVSRRQRIKNLAQLNAALPDVVPGALRERALVRYLRRLGATPDPGLRESVISLSLSRRHRWSGC